MLDHSTTAKRELFLNQGKVCPWVLLYELIDCAPGVLLFNIVLDALPVEAGVEGSQSLE